MTKEETNLASIQKYARVAGILFLLTLVFGFFGEAYAPGKFIAAGDAAATARNIMNSPGLYRLGFASYLIEALCDVALAWIFYVLLRPVNRDLALLSAFFGLVSTAVYAVAELFYFAALIILRNATALAAFSPEQLNALALLSLKISANCGWIFLAFYGVPSVLRGYLIYRSAPDISQGFSGFFSSLPASALSRRTFWWCLLRPMLRMFCCCPCLWLSSQ